jgi:hypothetical protein
MHERRYHLVQRKVSATAAALFPAPMRQCKI